MTKTMNKRSIIISAGVLFAALVTGCILWIYYMAPSSYLALDVNPSIEIHTNRLNQVTSIEPINEDAKQIMAGYELTDRNLETVIHNIVDRIILGGFLAPDKDNAILVSTDDSSSSSQITDTVNSIIANYLAEKQLNATVIPQSITVTSQSIEEAHDNYVSIGKMALIQELIANDNTLTVEQLSTLRISDLVALAESKNISLAGLFYSASTASNTTNEIQADASTNNNDALIDTEVGDNDLNENAIEDSDSEDQNDNDLEDREDGDNEDQNDNEDQADSKIEDREDNDAHEKSNIEDREDNDNEDQEDSKIEDREDSDNEDQEDSKIEDREDSDNEDQEDSYFEDREGNDNEDQQDSYHVEQKSNDREDQNKGDNED